MARWKYKTTILDVDAVIPPKAISCDASGVCVLDGIPGGLTALKEILDGEGESEWELVQSLKHGERLLLIWKKEVKEAFAS